MQPSLLGGPGLHAAGSSAFGGTQPGSPMFSTGIHQGNMSVCHEDIKYVEVPVIQEVIRQVPRKEIIEIEKKVPVYDYQYVDKIVEVPQIHYVDKVVEVPQIQEVIRRVPVPEIIEVPKEVIRRIPKIETRIVEKVVEVPGEIIEVPKPYRVENKVVVPTYVKKEMPTVVSQKFIPTIYESETDVMEVIVNEYVPKMVPVDVFVPKPISRQLVAEHRSEKHSVVNVPAAQWNSLVLQANHHVQNEADLKEIMICHGDIIPTLTGPGTQIIEPIGAIEGLEHRAEEEKFQIHVSQSERAKALAAAGQQSQANALVQHQQPHVFQSAHSRSVHPQMQTIQQHVISQQQTQQTQQQFQQQQLQQQFQQQQLQQQQLQQQQLQQQHHHQQQLQQQHHQLGSYAHQSSPTAHHGSEYRVVSQQPQMTSYQQPQITSYQQPQTSYQQVYSQCGAVPSPSSHYVEHAYTQPQQTMSYSPSPYQQSYSHVPQHTTTFRSVQGTTY